MTPPARSNTRFPIRASRIRRVLRFVAGSSATRSRQAALSVVKNNVPESGSRASEVTVNLTGPLMVARRSTAPVAVEIAPTCATTPG